MYAVYFVHSLTGMIMRTSQPQDNPSQSKGWIQISWDEYSRLLKTATFYADHPNYLNR